MRRSVGLAVLILTVAGATSTARAHDLPRTPPTPGPTVPAPPEDEAGTVTGGVTTGQTPDTLPLVPVPVGCEAPQLPHVVFVGTVVDRDFRTVRFHVDQVRAGAPAPFANRDDLIDVRYGLDVQYLADDTAYLVSALVDPDLGLLVSRVGDPIENFGGDEVIGVSETDVDCPLFEDPMRTLHLDGTPIETEVLAPLEGARLRIVGALLVPFAVAVGAIFVLAMLRLSVNGLARSVADAAGRRRSRFS